VRPVTPPNKSSRTVRDGFMKKHPLGARLILVGASIAVSLAIAEAGLRIAGFSYSNLYTMDPELGWTSSPNSEGWWTKEGHAYVKINSRGARDYEHAIAKPGHTIRIAILGDSFSEALQVSIENTYWSVMQRRLQAQFARRNMEVEVLNFGVSGFSTARELIMLRQRVWQYSPDVVILQVTPGNDISDNSRALKGDADAVPYFVYRDGALVLDDSLLKLREHKLTYKLQQSFAGAALTWLRNHLRIVGLIYAIREFFILPAHGQIQAGSEPGLNDNVYRQPINDDWERAWVVTEKLIAQIHKEVQAKGARFLVMTATKGIQVDPDEKARNEIMKRLGVSSLSYPEDRLQRLCDREHIDMLNLAPPFAEFAHRNQIYLHGFGPTRGTGHWNEAGHKLAGELLADRLLQKL
jgi:lysophospholipase L1-like esterase